MYWELKLLYYKS